MAAHQVVILDQLWKGKLEIQQLLWRRELTYIAHCQAILSSLWHVFICVILAFWGFSWNKSLYIETLFTETFEDANPYMGLNYVKIDVKFDTSVHMLEETKRPNL